MYDSNEIWKCIKKATTGRTYYEQLQLPDSAPYSEIVYQGERAASLIDKAKVRPNEYDPEIVELAGLAIEEASAVLEDQAGRRAYNAELKLKTTDGDKLQSNAQGEVLGSRHILETARDYFLKYDWRAATDKLKTLADSSIKSKIVTPEGLSTDKRLTNLLKQVGLQIWSNYERFEALANYTWFLSTLKASRAGDVAAINSHPPIERAVLLSARRIWQEYDFNVAPEHYNLFVDGCVACGVADKQTMGKECYPSALATAKRIWLQNNLATAPKLYEKFVNDCVTCGVADKQAMGKECYGLALHMAKSIWVKYDFAAAPKLYEKFVNDCVTCGVADKEAMGKECYMPVRFMAQQIWSYGTVETAPTLYEKFMWHCEVSAVASQGQLNKDCFQVAKRLFLSIGKDSSRETAYKQLCSFVAACEKTGVITWDIIHGDKRLKNFVSRLKD
jgi:hypothetical protein